MNQPMSLLLCQLPTPYRSVMQGLIDEWVFFCFGRNS